MLKMKCLMCNCERDFIEISLATINLLRDAGEISLSVKAYGCTECGFVQLFDKDQVNKKLEEIKKNEEYERKLKDYHGEIDKTQMEIEKLRAIINDENQTVKAVREAKEKIVELERKLNSIKKPEKRGSFYF